MSGDVSTRILAITARPSLSPSSFTRTVNSIPYGLPAPRGQRYGLTVFLTSYTTGLGSACPPVALTTTCSHYKQEQPATYRFGQCLTAALAHQN
ncbi:hypothetical protein [Xenorhabdus szentirmaii]|uniref:hypothetical protein n=1 Tax=Xenorhabdus szentirmaii TaxID=290112 RepID=UPI0019865018|nr:hypothetical protein [Xenorhabdus sp. 38]MBD2780514.1 hypothetical protein [Xenorhabdus sp. 38]